MFIHMHTYMYMHLNTHHCMHLVPHNDRRSCTNIHMYISMHTYICTSIWHITQCTYVVIQCVCASYTNTLSCWRSVLSASFDSAPGSTVWPQAPHTGQLSWEPQVGGRWKTGMETGIKYVHAVGGSLWCRYSTWQNLEYYMEASFWSLLYVW